MKNKIDKTIILTIDYELFLGDVTGELESCVINPTLELAKILAINKSKLTLFWDVLHYYMLKINVAEYPKLHAEIELIETQILELVKQGHDIQLHIHPHWLDAKFIDDKWVFDYSRFKLHNLSDEKDKDNIKTIFGCVYQSKNIMEQLIRRVKSDYKVTSFRAGGYLVEPFSKIKEALRENDIFVDSSVSPNMVNDNGIFSYNFNKYPQDICYRFNDTPKNKDESGFFIELPIKTKEIAPYRNFYFTLIKRLRYSNIEANRSGTGAGAKQKLKQVSFFKKFIKLISETKVSQLSTDGSFEKKFTYILNKSEHNSVMILHPKLLNEHTLSVIEKHMKTNKVRFLSIAGFLNNKSLCR